MSEMSDEVMEAVLWAESMADFHEAMGKDEDTNGAFQNHQYKLASLYRRLSLYSREYAIVKAKLEAAGELAEALMVAKRDIKNWFTSDEAKDAAVAHIDKAISRWKEAGK